MKKLLTILFVLFLAVSAFAEIEESTTKEDEISICPKTKMKNLCTECHVIPDWSLREKDPDANRVFPTHPDIDIRNDGTTAYVLLKDISSANVQHFFKYVSWHPEIDRCIFEIHSPGGSLFEAWRIVGLMELWKSKGVIIETRCYGFAASAGFIIFANGTKGYRFASRTAELMWHELYTFKFFDVSRPSDVEDESIVLRHLQDTASHYLAERSDLTAEQWNEKVRKKEFWCNGQEALGYGLSDGLPGIK